MRPITAKATPAAPSAMVCLDPWNGPALGVQVSPIGGATFTIDYSFDDPNDLVSPVPLGSMFWDSSFCPAGAIGGSTGVTFAIPTAPIWMRVRLLNAQGSVRATFTQLQSPLGGVGASSPPPPTREYAIALPDAGDSITMGNILDWDANQAWTCFGPVEITAHTTAFGQVIFTNCNTTYGAPTAGYELWLDESNSGLLRVRIMADYFANHFIDVQGSTNLIDFGPAFVVATYDGSRTAAGVKIYVNGVPETLAVILDALGAATIKTNGQNFIVGNQFSTVDVILGKMFFFQMENVALSPSVIATYSLDNRPPVTATTVLSLPFTEGTGNIAHDASTNAFEGAITSVLPMLSGAAVATSVAMTVPSGATVAVAIFAATGASLVVGGQRGQRLHASPQRRFGRRLRSDGLRLRQHHQRADHAHLSERHHHLCSNHRWPVRRCRRVGRALCGERNPADGHVPDHRERRHTHQLHRYGRWTLVGRGRGEHHLFPADLWQHVRDAGAGGRCDRGLLQSAGQRRVLADVLRP